MIKEKIERGDVFVANLNPVKGSEQGGKRPVIIIQNNIGNKHSSTVIVAAVTSRYLKKRTLPTHVALDCSAFRHTSQALLEQIRTIDKCRLICKIGHVNHDDMAEIGRALQISLALEDSTDE